MNVVLTIEGRDAIPVRALAYVSNWFAAPDEIATACATPPTKTIGDYSVRNRHSLPTYLVSGSAHRSMQPVEWESLILELECQEKGLKADERIDGENWARWRKQAVLLLPDGAFVWLDEFQQWYSNTRPLKTTSTPATDDEGDSFETESDHLNLDPFIPPEFREAIFSGFERYRNNGTTNNAGVSSPETSKKTKPGRKPGNQRARLSRIIEALEVWSKTQNQTFDRMNMPGPLGKDANEKGSFHWLAAQLDKAFHVGKRAFEEHRKGLCAVKSYAKPSGFYSDALPHIAQTLRAASSDSNPAEKRQKTQ